MIYFQRNHLYLRLVLNKYVIFSIKAIVLTDVCCSCICVMWSYSLESLLA